MIEIVIVGQNESGYIEKMYRSLNPYSYRRVWILDRCTDDSDKQLQELGEYFVKTNNSLNGRQTSHARNLGLSASSKDSDVLFLDGDRFPATGALYKLDMWDKDIALLMLEDDFRDNTRDFAGERYGRVNNDFYSCGIFIKRHAINKVLEFQSGELFSTEMQNDWGIEDTYLGDVCYHLGLTCDLYKDCRLRGRFDRLNLDSLDVLEKRFKKRERLNVKW